MTVTQSILKKSSLKNKTKKRVVINSDKNEGFIDHPESLTRSQIKNLWVSPGHARKNKDLRRKNRKAFSAARKVTPFMAAKVATKQIKSQEKFLPEKTKAAIAEQIKKEHIDQQKKTITVPSGAVPSGATAEEFKSAMKRMNELMDAQKKKSLNKISPIKASSPPKMSPTKKSKFSSLRSSINNSLRKASNLFSRKKTTK